MSDSLGTKVPFESPREFLSGVDALTAARLIESATDLALVVEEGVIKDVALASEELTRVGYDDQLRGQPWIDTVTIESKPKVEELLSGGEPRWRQVNHPLAGETDVPVRYTAVEVGEGRMVVLGRDLRSTSALQQRLVEAHQSLERDYSRLRESEARYAQLFQLVSQPVLILDATSLQVQDANPAAARVVGHTADNLPGTRFDDLFDAPCREHVRSGAADALSTGVVTRANLRLLSGEACEAVLSAFRDASGTRLIAGLRFPEVDLTDGEDDAQRVMLGVLEELPDALVVTGPDLSILAANRAFIDMTHLISRGQLTGSDLGSFLGRSTSDLNVLLASLRSHGVVKSYRTVLRDRFGNEEDAEVSAIIAPVGADSAYGFSVRSVARRLSPETDLPAALPTGPNQLAGLVGRMPLKQIVREATEFIEKLCVEAALELTQDNRASAAEMLGLSRQGLYSKIRRFGIDN